MTTNLETADLDPVRKVVLTTIFEKVSIWDLGTQRSQPHERMRSDWSITASVVLLTLGNSITV